MTSDVSQTELSNAMSPAANISHPLTKRDTHPLLSANPRPVRLNETASKIAGISLFEGP